MAQVKKWTDADLKKLLQEIVDEAVLKSVEGQESFSKPRRSFLVHHVGMTHAQNPYKNGWYVFIQNFESLTDAKRSKNDLNTRINFRIMSYSDSGRQPVFQVLVWHPSIGNQSESEHKIIFKESIHTGKKAFTQFMTTVINMTSK